MTQVTVQSPSALNRYSKKSSGKTDDDASSVPRDLLESWRQRDPIAVFRRRLAECGILTDEIEKEIDQRIEQEIQSAVSFAESSPWPRVEDTCKDVYSN